jgi:ATP-dependent DNA helicase DinG
MSPRFSGNRWAVIPRAWIFTSATLAVQGKFHHYCAELGLGEPESACWESPFDYGKQAVLYVPLGMPEPNSYGYTEAVVDAAFPAAVAAGGGAFLPVHQSARHAPDA